MWWSVGGCRSSITRSVMSKIMQSCLQQQQDNMEDHSEPPAMDGGDHLEHDVASAQQPQEKVPYKSYRKKYRKMEIQFNEQMTISDELHSQDIQAKKIFNRLLRQKTQLVETLVRLNNDHISQEVRIDDDKLEEYERKHPIDDDSKYQLTELGQHYEKLLDNTFEYSSDEKSQPPSRNPVGLLEWLKRNQPSILAEQQQQQQMEKPEKVPAQTNSRKKGTGGKGRKRKAQETEEEDTEDELVQPTPTSKKRKN